MLALLLSVLPTLAAPNVIVVLTDDLDMASYRQLDHLRAVLESSGTTFTHSYVSVSLCCPSRTTLLCGQYAHNHGVFGNQPPRGGYRVFEDHGLEDDTLGVLLQQGGYRTALLGKFLNGYPADDPHHVPAGWSTWAVPVTRNAGSGFDYELNEDGRIVHHGKRTKDYITDVLADKAVAFVEDAAHAHEPFFALVSTLAPHTPATPAPKYEQEFRGAKAPRTASFDEIDLSDKPGWIASNPALTTKQIAFDDRLWRKRLRSMLSVADLVDRLLEALDEQGVADETYLVFTSDNGFHLGQHRLWYGKDTAFEEDLQVPLVVRGPNVPQGRAVDALAGNVDLAPTVLSLAGLPVPERMDGRSLVPFLHGESPATWRQAYLLEHTGEVVGNDGLYADDDGPPQQAAGAKARRRGPPFVGIHTDHTVYLRYDDGDVEYYDLSSDPDQLQNLAHTAESTTLAALDAWTRALATCQGAACRQLEEAPPAP